MHTKYPSLAFVFLFLVQGLTAQQARNIKFGSISPESFILPVSSVIDSSTNAVILSDVGITEFEGNIKGWFSYVFKRKTRIKILNKKAFDLATVEVPLREHDDYTEKVTEIGAITYNLENGKVVETRFEQKDIFVVKEDKYNRVQKFTLPGVKEGSIIEYAYTVLSDFYGHIPDWEFQDSNYPCLWSEYQVTIPSVLVYVFDKRGIHPFSIDKADEGHTSYSLTQPKNDQTLASIEGERLLVSANTVKHKWVMKDVPAFYAENYLSTPKNYIDRIEFQLHQTNNGETSTDRMTTWAKATDILLEQKDFGSFMTSDENQYWLPKVLASIIKEPTDILLQAKEIYYYLSENFTCNSHYNKYIATTLEDVYKKHTGNVGELNLLLTAMLRNKKINASPVLLSTREFGYNYPGYPIIDRLNYVICRAEIDGKTYYLDASHPNLGFGNLPGNCYNGHARIISLKDSASVYFMADSIKEQEVTFVTIMNDEKTKGVLTGTFENHYGQIESYNLRTTIAASGEKKYFDDFKSAVHGDIDVTAMGIDSLHMPENPVKVHGDFTLKASDNPDIIYFNPLLWSGIKSNPFAAMVRKYPVEMSRPVNDTYILTMDIPDGYTIDEMPQKTRVTYNEGEGQFEYLIQKTETMVQLRCSLKIKKAFFDPEEYNSLRDFYAYIVKKESEQIVFKKNK